jgi:hypothetical protein
VNGDSTLRYELKLVCAAHWLSQARSWIRLHPAGLAVAFPARRVNSLYVDTSCLSALAANLQGLSTRRKLRWRWYGDEWRTIHPYLELKYKSNLLSTKRQFLLPCQLDMRRPWTEILKVIRTNAGPDWQLIFQTVDQPTLLTRYQREYYVTSDGAVRVTLDYAQTAYDQRFSARPNLHARLPIVDTTVVEVKADQDQAERVEEIVSRFPLPRSRNSKYVRGMLTALYSQ